MRLGSFLLLLISAPILAANSPGQDDLVRQWIAGNAVVLETTEPQSDIRDLLPFGEMVGDARLVGLGEPTHGNREIFRLKHRLIEYLVREKGFTHVGIEAPFAETSYLDDYVVHGRGSAEEALSYITMWAWDVEEVAALLDWMRSYNIDRPLATRLRIFGFDMQSPERAAREVLAALEELNPDLASRARRDLGTLAIPFLDPDGYGYRPILPSEADDAALEATYAVLDFINSQEVDPSRLYDIPRLRQLARNLHWWVRANHNNGDAYARIRDEAQAANIEWAMDQAGPDARAALWAHNVHLADLNSERLGGVDMAGRHLKRRFGDDYLVIGMFYAEGEITALEARPLGPVRTFDTGGVNPSFLEAHFHEDWPVALLDLSAIPQSGPVHEWFEQLQRSRHSGGGYSENDYAYATFDYNFPRAFDIIAVVNETTATRPISPQDTVLSPPLPSPTNLNFEETGGLIPNNWVAWSKQSRWGYDVSLVTSGSPEGRQHARLCRSPNMMGVDVAGSLVQYVNVEPQAGKKITISALTSAELENGAAAYLRIKIEPDPGANVHQVGGAIADTLDEIEIDHHGWRRQTATLEIPENSGYIMFGINLVGDGCVAIDDVRFEVSERQDDL